MRTTPFSKIDPEKVDREPDFLTNITVEKYEKCSFCNAKLIFSHDLNLGYLQVVETSRCPGCGVSTHPKKFTLQ